jgi:hypothetical protein
VTNKTEKTVRADQHGIASGRDATVTGSPSAKGGSGGTASLSLQQAGDKSHEITASALSTQLLKKDQEIDRLKAYIQQLEKKSQENEKLLSAYDESFRCARLQLKCYELDIPESVIISDYVIIASMFFCKNKDAFSKFFENLSSSEKKIDK